MLIIDLLPDLLHRILWRCRHQLLATGEEGGWGRGGGGGEAEEVVLTIIHSSDLQRMATVVGSVAVCSTFPRKCTKYTVYNNGNKRACRQPQFEVEVN